MKNIISSASKVVFVALAFTACIAFILEVFQGRVTFDTKDFMVLTGMAFAFYFSNKGENNLPFAGK